MKLEEIRDIVRTLQRFGLRTNLILDLDKSPSDNSVSSQFFRLLTEQRIQMDEEASSMIYGESIPGSKYKFLKSHFTSRAINSIAMLDLGNGKAPEHTIARYKAYKNLFSVSVLVTLGSRSAAMALARKTLPIAEKYELHHVAIELLHQLQTHELLLGDKKEYSKLSKQLVTKIAQLDRETKIDTLINDVRINFAKSNFIDEKLKVQAKNVIDQVHKLLTDKGTYRERISLYRLLYGYYQFIGNPLQSIEVCNEALKYMEAMPHLTTIVRLGEFSIYKLENSILLRSYPAGKEAALACENYFRPGMNNWFRYKELEFLLAMQTLKFEEALRIYDSVVSNKRFDSILEHLKDRWSIYGLYIHYVMAAEGIALQGMSKIPQIRTHLFRQKKYQQRIVNFSSYSKDKRGFNVSILLINILLLLENNKLNLLLDQVEALSSYRFKYLSGKHSKQSFLLFKVIRIMIDQDFDLTKIKRRASSIEQLLSNSAPSAGEVFESIQVLPPDWVWKRLKTIIAHQKK